MSKLKYLLKILGAGITAVLLLSLLLCAYSYIPVHVKNENGNTDYVWPANSFWVKMTEGISWGRFDENGFNNKEVISDPDIILLGSSHMEATNVMQEDNLVSVLNESLMPEHSVYNLGISGQSFYQSCSYLEQDLELYKDTAKIVIIESTDTILSEELVDAIMNHSFGKYQSYSDGIIGIMQRFPFFRVLYHQITGGLLNVFIPELAAIGSASTSVSEYTEILDEINYDRLFTYLEDLQDSYNIQLLIFYHPTGEIKEDGRLSIEYDGSFEAFAQAAENHNIAFVDLKDSFEQMYEKEHHSAYGFSTGRIGEGHLNKYGHKAIADCLYDQIQLMMGE